MASTDLVSDQRNAAFTVLDGAVPLCLAHGLAMLLIEGRLGVDIEDPLAVAAVIRSVLG